MPTVPPLYRFPIYYAASVLRCFSEAHFFKIADMRRIGCAADKSGISFLQEVLFLIAENVGAGSEIPVFGGNKIQLDTQGGFIMTGSQENAGRHHIPQDEEPHGIPVKIRIIEIRIVPDPLFIKLKKAREIRGTVIDWQNPEVFSGPVYFYQIVNIDDYDTTIHNADRDCSDQKPIYGKHQGAGQTDPPQFHNRAHQQGYKYNQGCQITKPFQPAYAQSNHLISILHIFLPLRNTTVKFL